MSGTAATLDVPDDLEACQKLLREQTQTLEAHVQQLASHSQQLASQAQQLDAEKHVARSHEQTIDELAAKIAQLEQDQATDALRIQELLRLAFGRRSERYIEDPNQLKLDFGDAAEGAADALAEALEEAEVVVPEHKRRKKKKKRDEGLPEHLPRYEVEAEVPEDEKQCPQHGQRELIGYDVTERLEFEPPKLKVRVTKYPKYACPNGPQCGVFSPERPTGLVEGDKYDAGVAAQVITAKYGYHLPVYRQQDIFASTGWTPSRSTLLNILEASAFVLDPLVEHVKRAVLADGRLGTDDTRTTLIVPENIPPPDPGDVKGEWAYEKLTEAKEQGKRSVTARFWAYRSVSVPLVFFDFTVSRQRLGPELILQDFTGTIMADCYSGYAGIALESDGRIERAACASHARRKVFDARDNYPKEASWLLAKFQQLYDLEDRAKCMSPDERLELRQTEAAPVWESIGERLESDPLQTLLPKSKLAGAVGYLRNHWGPLQVYLSDPRLPIDNNLVEQLMKQVALGRKNWLFIGSLAAGDRAAGFLTLVTSALRNDLDVWAYLDDVLRRLLAGETDYELLRPDRWAAEHPEAIRVYRQEERRDRADRKQARRAGRRRTARA